MRKEGGGALMKTRSGGEGDLFLFLLLLFLFFHRPLA